MTERMQPLCAALLRSSFEEGDDFLMYSWTSQSVEAHLVGVVDRVLLADIRGVLHASNDVMTTLTGQQVTSVSMQQSVAGAAASTAKVPLRVAFLHTPFMHFVVVFSGCVTAAVAEVRVTLWLPVRGRVNGDAADVALRWRPLPAASSSVVLTHDESCCC
jgi:hypothetical protein